MGERLINPKFNVNNKYNEVNIINPYRFGGSIYDDAFAVFSLRKIFSNWTFAVLRLRRSSDNAEVNVFFDTNSKITTNSLTASVSYTAPDSPDVTLGTWVGANDAFVTRWSSQNSSNTFVSGDRLAQATSSNQPQFISSGSILTKGGEPTIDFLNSTRYLHRFNSIEFDELDYGNDFTILTVSSNEDSGTQGALIDTRVTNSLPNERVTLLNSRLSSKLLLRVTGTLSNADALLLSQQDTSNQKLLTGVVKSSQEATSYSNGVVQTVDATWTGTYDNVIFLVGMQIRNADSLPLNGTMQEIVMFPTDKTSDLTGLHADINSYYSIY